MADKFVIVDTEDGPAYIGATPEVPGGPGDPVVQAQLQALYARATGAITSPIERDKPKGM